MLFENSLLVVSETIVELAKYALIAYLGRASLDYLKYRLEVLGKDATIFVRRTGTNAREQKIDAARLDTATTPAEQIAFGPAEQIAFVRGYSEKDPDASTRRTPGPLELDI